jgi:murein DD-endopeptidase MepM/ murein hydrolase activator NlpD
MESEMLLKLEKIRMCLKNKAFLFSFFVLLGCSNIKMIDSNLDKGEDAKAKNGQDSSSSQKEVTNEAVTFEIKKIKIKPGEASLLVHDGDFSLYQKGGSLKCGKKTLPHFFSEGRLLAFLSESYFSKFEVYDCLYSHPEKSFVVATVEVLNKDFPSEKLRVDKKRVFLNKKHAKRAAKERAIRHKAYSNSPKYPLFTESFALPIRSKVTSIYGSKRIFNNKKQTQHLGTDFRAKVGTPIKAANRGRVVISRKFFYTGHTVVIDHGLGIFTLYGHLSKRLVLEGEIIPKGMTIGHAGATGRVTGPHLHWGVTVNSLAIEGSSLVKASKGFVK